MELSTNRNFSDTEKISADLISRLRTTRKNLGLSQDQVAAAVGMTRVAISMIESGTRKVDAIELAKFSSFYRKDVAWLLSSSAQEKDPQYAALQHLADRLSKGDLELVERFCRFLISAP